MKTTPDQQFKTAVRSLLIDEVAASQAERTQRRPTALRPTGYSQASGPVRTAIITACVGAGIAASWFGATTLLTHKPTPIAPAATGTSASSSPTPTADPILAALKDTVGTGKLSGPITGDFTITYGGPIGATPELRLRNLDVGSSTARDVLLSVGLDSAKCNGGRAGTIAGRIGAARSQTVELQDSSPQTLTDLSYMSALAIWPGTTGNSCVASKVSAGEIHWTVAPVIRALASRDHGSRPGATGSVTEKDGRPIQYTVAGDDEMGAVAARFGITEAELLYLNPLRARGNNPALFEGEQLNLDPLDRGRLY